ncbi:hypothetical protein ACFXKS_04970 [Streptomyces scopuliridis]
MSDEPLWADRWRIPRTPQGGFGYLDYRQGLTGRASPIVARV